MIVWYARSRVTPRMGPFKTSVEALNALRAPDGYLPDDAWFWPEQYFGPVEGP